MVLSTFNLILQTLYDHCSSAPALLCTRNYLELVPALFFVLTMSHTAGVPITRRRSERLAAAAGKARCLKVSRLQEQQQRQRHAVPHQHLSMLRQDPALTAFNIACSDNSSTMPPPPSSHNWAAVQSWVDEYERRGYGDCSDAWRAWRVSQPADPLVIPSFELPRRVLKCHDGRGHVAVHVALHIGQWIVANRYHISRQAMANHQTEYVFDDNSQKTTISSVFVNAGVIPPISVVFELLHHQDVEGDLVFSFKCGRQLVYSFAPALSMTRSH